MRARVARLLRGQVIRRAEQNAFAGQLLLLGRVRGVFSSKNSRARPMSRILMFDFDGRLVVAAAAAGNQHQIGRLQIAMDHPLLVNVLQAEQRLMDQPHRFAGRQALAALQHLVERLAFEILHDEIMDALGLADLESADDIGMLELDRQPGLALEASQHLAVLGARRRQHLDGDDLAGWMHSPCKRRPCARGRSVRESCTSRGKNHRRGRATACRPDIRSDNSWRRAIRETPGPGRGSLASASQRSRIACISSGAHQLAANEKAAQVFDLEFHARHPGCYRPWISTGTPARTARSRARRFTPSASQPIPWKIRSMAKNKPMTQALSHGQRRRI